MALERVAALRPSGVETAADEGAELRRARESEATMASAHITLSTFPRRNLLNA